MGQKIKTTEWFLEKAKKIYGDKFDYSKSVYTFSKNTIEIGCKLHGSFHQRASAHLSGNGCPVCNRRISIEDFLEKSKLIHGNKYDYSLVSLNGGDTSTEIVIICKIHGMFNQTVHNHLRKRGCNNCGKVRLPSSKLKTREMFIGEAIKKHHARYDYSLVTYKNNHTKIEIICRIHGSFWQTPANHTHIKLVQGCPKCAGNIKKTTEQFIKEAVSIHGNKYDYSLVEYKTSKTYVSVNCLNHGLFDIIPTNHLKGKGCPKCAHRISKPEIQWLNFLHIPSEHRQQFLKMKSGKSYQVDAFVPETNTVYEFLGDFWHGNPSKFKKEDLNPKTKCTYGELYCKSLSKLNEIKMDGYNLVYIWEFDFNKLKLNLHK